jgi:methylenetetrahydrofolate dehydrogenase (NADP+)/methenyltetrahydrofolate cyclohydrolase
VKGSWRAPAELVRGSIVAAKIIDGKEVSAGILTEIALDIDSLKASAGIVPGLAVILVGDDPGSQIYVRSKGRAAKKIGIYSEQHTLSGDASPDELLAEIGTLNENPRIHGILVQLPLPRHIDEQRIVRAIDPAKDVDGLHPMNLGKLLRGEEGFRPCTPFGIQKLLASAGVHIEGSHVVVVGRSNLVGKPVAALLAQKGKDADATVTLCHSRTRDLPSLTRQADILIAALGRPEFVTADMVKEGAVVIDVGINRVEDNRSEKGYRIVGDVKFDEVCAKCSAITPVPGGVGSMTVTMLLYNTVLSARWHAPSRR